MSRLSLPPHLLRLAAECDIVAYRSSGPGGQKKNKTESAVRVRHRPTGLTRVATRSRSQIQNKYAALERLWEELERRARPPVPRTATRPTASSVSKRLDEKHRRSRTKRTRGAPPREDD